jgi:hypothetical protein
MEEELRNGAMNSTDRASMFLVDIPGAFLTSLQTKSRKISEDSEQGTEHRSRKKNLP